MLARSKWLAARLVSLLTVTAVLLSGFAYAPAPAAAADYDPTYAISNDNMRHATSMSVKQIQGFLDSKTGPLKSLRTKDYAGVERSAAEIIYLAARRWQINPKILLVTLQKEQSLITTSNSNDAARLRKAMGCGVYDVDHDGVVENLYPGFGNQVWNAARLLDKYGEPYDTSATRRAWATSGYKIYDYALRKTVVIYPKNVATLKLYVYTPYSSGPKTTQSLYRQYFGSPFTPPRFVSIYRFRNRSNGTYLYTGSIAERHKLLTAAYASRWAYEGYKFSWDTSVPVSATIPVYRFKNKVTKKLSYTVSQAKYDYRTSAVGKLTWISYGQAYRVSLKRTEGSVPVYRFYNRYTGGMFLTTSAATVKKWTTYSKYRRKWRYDGVAYYLPRYKAPAVPSTPSTDTPSTDTSSTTGAISTAAPVAASMAVGPLSMVTLP